MSVWVNGHELRSLKRRENAPPAIGDRVGKYRIVRDLGTVGMARAWLAALEGPGGFSKAYVVKRISPAQVPTPRLAGMLANEARVAAALDHANIVRLLEFFQEDDDSYFLVLEHVDGVSLDQLLRAARRAGVSLGADFAAEVGLPLARALAQVHGLKRADDVASALVHGDVSPSNVLLSREGAVKLTNVGVANSAVAAQPTVGLNAKLAYMSPEQLAGMPPDHRSDLYSLGAILYEVATGARLAGGEAPRVEVGAEPSIVGIVARLLRRDPAGRHQGAVELAADLEALRASRPVNVRSARLADAVRTCLAAAEAAPTPTPAPGGPSSLAPVAPTIAAPAVARSSPPAPLAQPAPAVWPLQPAPFAQPARPTPAPFTAMPAAVVPAVEAEEVPVKLVLAISLACLIGSLIFWFAVF